MLRNTDRLFDMNHDGKLDIAEEALKYEFMDHYAKSARGNYDPDVDFDPDIDAFDDDIDMVDDF